MRDAVRRGLWLLCALLLAGCHAQRADDTPAPTLDVVTLNLWHDRDDWPRREAMIVAQLRRLDPDVVLLQEVLQHDGLPNQAQTLARQLGYRAYFVSVDPPGRARRYGNAILTRETPLMQGQRPLQPHDDYRIAAWVRVPVHGRRVNVYVAHLNFTDRSGATRTRQVADLLDFVAATRGDAPVLVGGDFNTPGDAPELAPLRACCLDAYAQRHAGEDLAAPAHVTLNPRYNPPARIDLLFAQHDGFRVIDARRILDQPAPDGTWASDHFGVWARLAFVPAD